MQKAEKAYEKLKTMADFSNDYAAFEALFFERLQPGKEQEALKLLLQAFWRRLQSEGERFNTLLSVADEETRNRLLTWLEQSYKKAVGGDP